MKEEKEEYYDTSNIMNLDFMAQDFRTLSEKNVRKRSSQIFYMDNI